MTKSITATRDTIIATGRNSDFPQLSESKAVIEWRRVKVAGRIS